MIKLSLAKYRSKSVISVRSLEHFCSCYTQATTNNASAMAPFVGPNELLQRLEKLEKLVEDGETKKFRIVTADAIIVIVLIIVFVMTIE